jgi:hypothetical protein
MKERPPMLLSLLSLALLCRFLIENYETTRFYRPQFALSSEKLA